VAVSCVYISEPFGYHKKLVVSRLAEQLLASQEGPFSVKLVATDNQNNGKLVFV
jgi:hypothetical protein